MSLDGTGRGSRPVAAGQRRDENHVLRQYDPATGSVVVPSTAVTAGSGASIWRHAANDASGWNDEGKLPVDTTLTRTFTLAGTRKVGGYMVQFEGAPTTFALEGSMDGEAWSPLVTLGPDPAIPHAGKQTGTFAAADVNYIRYVATGPTTPPEDLNDYFRLHEMHVYLAEGEYATLTDGYNNFADQSPSYVTSSNSAVWAAPNGGNGGTLMSQEFTGHLKAQTDALEGGDRAFVLYAFADALPMNYATLGGYKEQKWADGWEMYTAGGPDVPELQNLEGNDPAAIQAAGWTLQRQSPGSQVDAFSLMVPGSYKFMALVWDTTPGGCVEFELFNGQVPLNVTAFEVADQLTGATDYTESRTVNVTAFAAAPSYLGTAINGYLITESAGTPVPNDPRWLTERPETYTITGPSGELTIYGWVRDDAGEIAGASQQILYFDPNAPLKFANSSNANVLRQYDPEDSGNPVAVPSTVTTTGGASMWRHAANDGSNWNDEGKLLNGQTLSRTFTLRGEYTVGSFRVRFEPYPTQFILEGSTDGENWFNLMTLYPDSNVEEATFDPAAVSYVRYTAVGPMSSGEYYRMPELQVFLSAGQTMTLNEGFNFLRDQDPPGTLAQNAGVWADRNGGDINTLKNGDYQDHLKCQDEPYGDFRTFVTYSFRNPVHIGFATLGFYKEQGWMSGWECYTSNADEMPDMQNLGGNDTETIQAASSSCAIS